MSFYFRFKSIRMFFLCLAIPMLFACGTLSRIEYDKSEAIATRYAREGNLKAEVDSLAQPLIDTKQTPGIVVGVLLPDGSKQYFGYGVTEQGGTQPDGHTLFAIGSVSKGFLSAIAAQMVHEGVLSWDDTLEKLLPDKTTLSSDAKKITLLQLATHTSGLPRQPMTPQTLTYFIEYLFTGESFYKHFTRDYILRYMEDFDAPDELKPQYSNIGYGLLSYILEYRSGKNVDTLLQEKVIQPLGLTSTGYTPEKLPGFERRARGHAGDQPKFIRRGTPVPDWQFTDVMRGAAAAYSDAEDMLTYASAHLRGSGNPVLDAALKDTLVVRFDQPQEAAAIAWIVDDVGGHKITYQVGLVAGYTTYLGLDVEHGTAVVVMQNSFNWTNSVGHRLLLRLAQLPPQQ